MLYVGLGLSLALHVVLIALASLWLEPEYASYPAVPERPAVEPRAGMRAVALSEPGDAERVVDVPERPRDEVAPARTAPTAEPAEPTDEPAEPSERRTAAERLAPRVVEPELWRPMVLLPREPNLDDVQARLAEAMELLSDSALAEAERAMRARDWTVEDGSGGKWGISPGKLHLGSVTLPLPIYFPVDMAEQAQRRYWDELETQLDRAEFFESFDARVKAIRERRDRERTEQRGTEGNGGSR